MLTGGVVGAKAGAKVGRKLQANQLRFLLALMVLGMGIKMAIDLVATPESLYSLASY